MSSAIETAATNLSALDTTSQSVTSAASSPASEAPTTVAPAKTTNYIPAVGRFTAVSGTDTRLPNAVSATNSKKPAASAVPVALPIMAPSIAPKPVPGAGSYNHNQPSERGHLRRKSSIQQQSSAVPQRPVWSQNNNGVQFAGQNQLMATNGGSATPIQFGSISTTGSAQVPVTNSGLPPIANLGSLGTTTAGLPLSNSASPVAPHAVISGGVPSFQSIPTGAVMFGTVETTERHTTSQPNPTGVQTGNNHMRPDTVPPTPPTTQIPSQSPRRPNQQPFTGPPNHQYPSNYVNNFTPGASQSRVLPRGGSNSYQPQSYPLSPQNGRNARPFPSQSPGTPRTPQAQMAMSFQQQMYSQPYTQPYGGQQFAPEGYYQYGQPTGLIYPGQPGPQAQPFYPQQDRVPSLADQSPRVAQIVHQAPVVSPVASPALIVKPTSRAIKIIDPTTHTEVKIEKKVATPVLAHSVPVSTPERGRTPVSAGSLGHSRQASGTPVSILSEDERREIADKTSAEAREKINQSLEKERRAKEEAELKAKEEEERKAKEEADRLKKEEERLAKEEEERLAKEKELLAQQEAERLKAEEEARAKAEEEARVKAEEEAHAKAEEEARAKAAEDARVEAEVEAEEQRRKAEEELEQKSSAEAEAQKKSETKEITDDETPLSTGTPTTPEYMGSPTLPASVPKSDPSSKLELEATNTVDTSFAVQLKNAKPIQNFAEVTYPEGVSGPARALNAKSEPGKFRYDPSFLLQFANVVTGRPTEDWEQRSRNLQDGDDSNKRPSASRTNSTTGRQGSRSSNLPSMAFAGMGQLGSLGQLGLKSSLLQSDRGFPKRQNSDLQNPLSSLNRTPSFGKAGQNMMNSVQNSRSGRQGGNNSNGNNRGKRMMERTPSGRDLSNMGNDYGSGASTPVEEKVEPLVISANRWKPRITKEPEEEVAPDGSVIYPPDVVQRKVNGLLNKMTLEKFDKISDQIIEITSQARWERDGRTLRQVIELTFQKATDEAHWSNMYARFCKKVLESLGDDISEENVVDRNGELVRGGALFRKYLLSKCQTSFEQGWKAEGEAELLTDEYYKSATVKRRGLGLVRFVGELFMLGMISNRIIHRCVTTLLNLGSGSTEPPSEEELESVCGLLTTIGYQLEHDSERQIREHVNYYFMKLNEILNTTKLPSRIKFMIMDVIELRQSGWKSRKTVDKGPKTIQQIHEEALKEQAIKDLTSP